MPSTNLLTEITEAASHLRGLLPTDAGPFVNGMTVNWYGRHAARLLDGAMNAVAEAFERGEPWTRAEGAVAATKEDATDA